MASLVYDFGPDGATLEPPITLTITYNPALIPEGVAEENLVIAMWDEDAGEWVELPGPFTIDTENNTISAPVSHFTAFTVLAYTRPAAFTATDLVIAPEAVDIGETVTISVLVTNTGDLPGSYKVIFTTTKDIAGTYAVTVDGQVGTFVVEAPINWTLIGGIIVAVVVVGLVVFFFLRRRAY